MDAKQTILPRWRGFNILGMFCTKDSSLNDFRSPGYFVEEDFKMIADWGFDFVRLPLSYRFWSDVKTPYEIKEEIISRLDEAVYFAEKYKLHTNIAMHRLPGYCVNADEKIEEPYNLWRDKEALDAAVYQWTQIAKRYQNIGTEKLSFNLINEPNWTMTPEQYNKVSGKVIDEVRKITPDRFFILDGIYCGDIPPIQAMGHLKNCGYSCRGYKPGEVAFHGLEGFTTTPKWPDEDSQTICDRKGLERLYGMWAALAEIWQVGVHCGEMGVYYKCSHDVAMRWLEDVLDVLKSYNIGYAFWNLRGKFGIMDNGRTDIEMKNYNVHTLDTKMLKLLQKY